MRDSFVLGSFDEFPQRMRNAFDYETFFVDEANSLVVLLGDDLSTPTMEFPAGSEAHKNSVNLWLFISRNYVGNTIPPLHLSPPNDKYWIECYMSDRERESRDCMFMHEHLEAVSPMVMRVYNMYKPLSDEHLEELRKYLQSWHQKATMVDVHGERLETGPIEFHRVTIPPTENTPLKDGFDVVFPYNKGVNFPWIELYVNARRTFPKKYRPSFEFVRSLGWTRLGNP